MGQKLKIAGWVSIGVIAGALTTVQLQAVARGGLAPLPLFHVGLSSGGHLAGVMACQPHPPPLQACGAVIAYAPLNANHRAYKAPADKPDYPPPQKQAFYDAWPIGLASEAHGMPRCPVFLAYALHDGGAWLGAGAGSCGLASYRFGAAHDSRL